MRSLRDIRNTPTDGIVKICDWGWVRDILEMFFINLSCVYRTWLFKEGKVIEKDTIINGHNYNWQRRDNVFYRNSHTEIQTIMKGDAMRWSNN